MHTIATNPQTICILNQHLVVFFLSIIHHRVAPMELFPRAETTRIPLGQGGDAARQNVLPVLLCLLHCRLEVVPSFLLSLESDSFYEEDEKKRMTTNLLGTRGSQSIPPYLVHIPSMRPRVVFLFLDATGINCLDYVQRHWLGRGKSGASLERSSA